MLIWLWSLLNFINPSAVNLSSNNWSIKSWYYQCDKPISDGLVSFMLNLSLFLSYAIFWLLMNINNSILM